MQLQFWGAAQTVTGSMHLLTVGGRRILLDCGLYQGRRKEAFEINRDLPFDASTIDAVLLSHAHIDHSGNLPSLFRAGFRGPIYATSATRDLCAYMLLDSAHIQESDVKYVNKRRRKQGKVLLEPLYERDDAIETLKRFRTEPFDREFEVLNGIRARFINAGHILGAASIILDLEEDGHRKRLVFSGDIGRNGQPILRDPEIAADADYLIIESTYGNRSHEGTGEAKTRLKEAAADAVASGGKLIIPSFAVGRTQEIVYRLNQLWENGELPLLDVYVDSPLAVNATEVFRMHPECYDREMLDTLQLDDDNDPLGFARLRYIREAANSKLLNALDTPAIIISASGMCEGGRILHHLRNNIGDERNTIMFVGYQAQHTLGRRILEGREVVRIYGQEYEVRAKVHKVNGYSAHADREELIDWAVRTKDHGQLKQTFLVHGELESMQAFTGSLSSEGFQNVEIPERSQSFDL